MQFYEISIFCDESINHLILIIQPLNVFILSFKVHES